MSDPTKPPVKHLPHGNYARADWFEAKCEALAAELAERTTANQQLAAIGQSQDDRIRALEARDHCPCEDCKRARESESETTEKPGE